MKGFYKKGVGVLEVIVSITLIFIFIVSIATALQFLITTSINNTKNLKATFLLEEGLEAIDILRDVSWSTNIASLTEGTEYYIDYTAGNYVISTTPSTIDSFTRSFDIETVDRDSDDDIASSGTLDPNTFKVNMNVAWNEKGETKQNSIETYIHNYYDN